MTGTRHLQRHKRLLSSKEAELRKKFRNFERQNTAFPRAHPIHCPTFEEVKTSPIADSFWDFGQLPHPEEPWASDQKLQEGIKAFLTLTHSEDELRRIARECRQLVNWTVKTNKNISKLKDSVYHAGTGIDLFHYFFVFLVLLLIHFDDDIHPHPIR